MLNNRRLIETLTNLILEASRLDNLQAKLGFNKSNAEFLDRTCGKLSIWIGNKIKDFSVNQESTDFNRILLNLDTRQAIVGVMDYIRVGLNSNIASVKGLTITELVTKAQEWHESLNIGDSDIDYEEENDIIVDFRDDNGIGYYWADLDTYSSDEECQRMGHCGRSSRGFIFSLRKTSKIEGTSHTKNKSLLTAAIGDGIMYQLKGPKNSKPQEKYYKYILPLFYHKISDDEYLINGIGYEYDSKNDFKISDLSDDVVLKLYEDRPELFSSYSQQLLLKNLGVKDLMIDTTHLYTFKFRNVEDLIDCGKNIDCEKLFTKILIGDAYDLFNYYESYNSVRYALDALPKESKEFLTNEVNRVANEQGKDISDLDLEDSIEELDLEYEVLSSINTTICDAEQDAAIKDYYEKLRNCLEEYGEISEINHDEQTITLKIKILDLISQIPEENIDEIFSEYCGDDLDCVVEQVANDGNFSKPKFEINDYNYYSYSDDLFNDIFRGLLDI